jgi:eukaryotic-like serine/threonine-protein kinase
MYYQQSSTKVFVIAFVTSLVVSAIVSFAFINLIPNTISGNTSTVIVPDVGNLELQRAETIMDEKGLKVIVEDQKFNPTIRKGRVLYQNPIAGETVKKGSTVSIALSKGPKNETETEEVIVPSVIGFDINQAKVYIAEKGLTVGVVEKEESEQAKDVVIKTIPEPGQKVTEGLPIKLIVSSGGGKVPVPNLRGKSEYRARAMLEEKGLEVGNRRTTTSAEHAFDIIIYQEPSPGTMLERGSKVNITINREG